MSKIHAWGAVGAVAVLLPFAPPAAAAPAAPAAGQDTSIVVAVAADAPPTRAGTRAPAAGTIQLTTSGTGVAGLSVHLQMRAYGATTFTTVGTVVSGPSGSLSTSTPVLYRNATFRWRFDGKTGFNASTSSTWVERVSPRVGIRVSDLTPAVGQRVVVHGRTNPNRAGRVVSVWRGTKPVQGYGPVTQHTRLTSGLVHADGRYRLVVRFAASGNRRIYVKVRGGGGNVAGYSKYRWLSVH